LGNAIGRSRSNNTQSAFSMPAAEVDSERGRQQFLKACQAGRA
jgi:hypothetical protein